LWSTSLSLLLGIHEAIALVSRSNKGWLIPVQSLHDTVRDHLAQYVTDFVFFIPSSPVRFVWSIAKAVHWGYFHLQKSSHNMIVVKRSLWDSRATRSTKQIKVSASEINSVNCIYVSKDSDAQQISTRIWLPHLLATIKRTRNDPEGRGVSLISSRASLTTIDR